MGKAVKTVALELQPCCGNRSGVGTYTFELAKRLQSDDELSFCGNVFNFCGREFSSNLFSELDMPVRECKLLPYGAYRRMWHCVPFRYERYFNRTAALSVFFDYIAPPRIKGKVLTTIHDLSFRRYPESAKASNRSRIERDITYSVNRSSRVITISKFSKKEIVQLLDISPDKISVVSPAPSIEYETTNKEVLLRRYGVREPYLLYVGTIEPRKNLVRLIEAFALLKQLRRIPHQLVLAGGMGWKSDEFKQTFLKNPEKDDIKLTGYITNADKNSLYQNADAFVFPSVYEGFGIPPLEAMRWGCPVVAANAASLPEVCGDAAVFVDPLDIESIANGIWQVISGNELAAKLREQGYQQQKKYTWETSAQGLKNVCREVLDE